MKKLTWLLPLVVVTIHAHAQKKEDRRTLGNLQTHVSYLESEQLHSRSTGAPGEQKAAAYMASQMQQTGLAPLGDNGFLQTFPVKETREPAAACRLMVNEEVLLPGKQYVPLPFSAEKSAKGEAIPNVNEPDNIWLINAAEMDAGSGKTMQERYLQQTQVAEKSGASGVVFYNGKETPAEVTKWLDQKPAAAGIPAVWAGSDISKKLNADDAGGFRVNMQIAFKTVKLTGTNVIGYINNKAPRTIIIGAHYDYPGWDTAAPSADNACGTAALLEIARLLKGSRLHNNNYVIIAFSGKEQGLYGSKYFAAHPGGTDLSQVNYMISLDGIGQQAPGKPIQVGGTNTSPGWAAILQQAATKELPLAYDSTGANPADHTSFYQKNIPVLYFNTGGAGSNKINYEGTLDVLKLVYNIIDKTSKDKLAFSKAD